MKQLLLLSLLLGFAGPTRAQLFNVISTGVRIGVNAGVAAHSQSRYADPKAPNADASVTPAAYRGQTYPLKRTPPHRLKGPGRDQVAYQESELAKCQAALVADSTQAIGNAETWSMLRGSLEIIARDRPNWNIQAYREEAAFYEAENARRQRVAAAAPH